MLKHQIVPDYEVARVPFVHIGAIKAVFGGEIPDVIQ